MDLAAVSPVEHHRVRAGAALEAVGSVARIPDEDVVTAAQERSVRTAAAVRDVLAATAVDGLGAALTEERVIAVPAGNRGRLSRRRRH